MKLVFLSSSTGWGGLEQNLLRYAEWMQEAGATVSVLSVSQSPLHQSASSRPAFRNHRSSESTSSMEGGLALALPVASIERRSSLDTRSPGFTVGRLGRLRHTLSLGLPTRDAN